MRRSIDMPYMRPSASWSSWSYGSKQPWTAPGVPATIRVMPRSLPPLKREGDDLTTCMLLCVKPAGHRPAAPHRCADGHKWLIDAETFYAAFRSQGQG